MMLIDFVIFCVFFFKQKTAYEMRISDWSSDVCSSDLSDSYCGGGKPAASETQSCTSAVTVWVARQNTATIPCGGVSSGGSAIHTDRIGGFPDDMAKYREVLREAPNTKCIVYRATHNPRQAYPYTWSGYPGTPLPVVYPMEPTLNRTSVGEG